MAVGRAAPLDLSVGGRPGDPERPCPRLFRSRGPGQGQGDPQPRPAGAGRGRAGASGRHEAQAPGHDPGAAGEGQGPRPPDRGLRLSGFRVPGLGSGHPWRRRGTGGPGWMHPGPWAGDPDLPGRGHGASGHPVAGGRSVRAPVPDRGLPERPGGSHGLRTAGHQLRLRQRTRGADPGRGRRDAGASGGCARPGQGHGPSDAGAPGACPARGQGAGSARAVQSRPHPRALGGGDPTDPAGAGT